jgi:hypothetical protein
MARKKSRLPAASTRHSRYHLRVRLLDIEPPIWRLIELPGHLTLQDLHEVFQIVMGWENYHMFSFEVSGKTYGAPGVAEDLDFLDASAVTLEDLALRKSRRFLYEYDFGDGWVHEVEVEEVQEAHQAPSARVLDGARACPPEDSGGPHGYADLLDALADPDHEDHEELSEWVSEDFDPESWSPRAAERQLRRFLKGRETQRKKGGGSKKRTRGARRDEASPREHATARGAVPELEDVLNEMLEALGGAMGRAVARDRRFPDPILAGATKLLDLFGRRAPIELLSARKPQVWAAAALHASSMMFVPYLPGHATLEDLAKMWNVSPASVSARSLQLREGVRLTGGLPWPPMLLIPRAPRTTRSSAKPARDSKDSSLSRKTRAGRQERAGSGNDRRPTKRADDPDQGSLF